MSGAFEFDVYDRVVDVQDVFDLPGSGVVYEVEVSAVHDSVAKCRGGIPHMLVAACVSGQVSFIQVIR